MRFTVVETNVDGVGECFQLIDEKDEFGEWYSLSEHDLTHLASFLNKQDYYVTNSKEVITGLVKHIDDKNEKIKELINKIKVLEEK